MRRSVTDRKLVGRLRDDTAHRAGAEEPELVALRRVSWAGFGMAVATLLGVYLLIGQLADVDYQAIVEGAIWGWIPVVALFSQLPQLGSAIAMLGSVSRPLPLRPVVVLNYANNFTGLIGGTVATTAMVVRFFQRQGMGPAVAVSSGVLSSVAALVIQTVLVVTGLLFTSASFDLAAAAT